MNTPIITRRGIQGTCEICEVTTEVFSTQGRILMCQPCIDKETEVVGTLKRENEMSSILNQSRAIDQSIELKADIFNAGTIAAVELQAAIQADASIADSDKEYTYAKMCEERLKHHQKVLFDKRQSVTDEENLVRMWQAQTQTAASKVRDERREHFKNLNVNYSPKVLKEKEIKPKETRPRINSSKMQDEIRAAAAKYKVEASTLQMLMLNKGLFKTADEAAASIARGMAAAKSN